MAGSRAGSQASGRDGIQFWQEALLDGGGAVRLQLPDAFLALRSGRGFIEIGFVPAKRGGTEAQVDVFRESVDGVEYLGK